MVGFIIEFSLVLALFGWLFWRQIRARRRISEQAAQLDFDFRRDDGRGR